MNKTLESKTRIQYQDCDPFNHLNNSRYIDYMVGARTEQLLEQYNLNTAEIAQNDGLGWVAAQTQISYLSPASWMEVVTIESKLIQFSAATLVIEALMWNELKTQLKSVMWSTLVHFHIRTQKSHPHSAALMQLFSEINCPLGPEMTFEARARSFRESKKLRS